MFKLNGKSISLTAGVFQQAALVLIIRYSKTRKPDHDVAYLTSVAVMMAEVFKLCLSYVLEFLSTETASNTNKDHDDSVPTITDDDHDDDLIVPTSPRQRGSKLRKGWNLLKQMFTLNKESMKIMIPAVLYLIQNNLLFVALTHLSVPTYQLTNQGKLLTTALISRVLLKKQITTMQYCAISLLGIGVAIVNLSEHLAKMKQQDGGNNVGSSSSGQPAQKQWLGFLAVLISCFTSGFAGVYFEFVLKTTTQSVHYRNFQLALWSFLFALVHIASTDMLQVKKYGLFHGFDFIVILIVINQAMTGFVVSMMLKYADAVLKGFAISIAAVVASAASIFLFDTEVNGMLFVGGALIAISVKMYSSHGAGSATGQQDQKTNLSPRNQIQQLFAKRRMTAIFSILVLFVFSVYSISGTIAALNIVGSKSKCGDTDTALSFLNPGTNKTFKLPTDMDYLTNRHKPWGLHSQSYLRDTKEITKRGQMGKCGSTLDVIAWVMDKMNENDGTLMLGFGGLIHLHREKDFINATTGGYIDDDFDFWASPQSVEILSQLEPELFQKFGFTLRFLLNKCGYIILGQMMATCGMKLNVGKIVSSQPGIDIYLLAPKDEDGTLVDLWETHEFPNAMIYPRKQVQFKSTRTTTGTSLTLNLQLPREELEVMSCLYGNWKDPSDHHASGTHKKCNTTLRKI